MTKLELTDALRQVTAKDRDILESVIICGDKSLSSTDRGRLPVLEDAGLLVSTPVSARGYRNYRFIASRLSDFFQLRLTPEFM